MDDLREDLSEDASAERRFADDPPLRLNTVLPPLLPLRPLLPNIDGQKLSSSLSVSHPTIGRAMAFSSCNSICGVGACSSSFSPSFSCCSIDSRKDVCFLKLLCSDRRNSLFRRIGPSNSRPDSIVSRVKRPCSSSSGGDLLALRRWTRSSPFVGLLAPLLLSMDVSRVGRSSPPEDGDLFALRRWTTSSPFVGTLISMDSNEDCRGRMPTASALEFESAVADESLSLLSLLSLMSPSSPPFPLLF
mmetsp:Transcript_30561/g.53010  ORF Transcript_30561/g.53010 Transcript_30561/m.53010 type:complete len:246 (-) Transcript_30561:331-1068(-)